jgi:hypothetical protein
VYTLNLEQCIIYRRTRKEVISSRLSRAHHAVPRNTREMLFFMLFLRYNIYSIFDIIFEIYILRNNVSFNSFYFIYAFLYVMYTNCIHLCSRSYKLCHKCIVVFVFHQVWYIFILRGEPYGLSSRNCKYQIGVSRFVSSYALSHISSWIKLSIFVYIILHFSVKFWSS